MLKENQDSENKSEVIQHKCQGCIVKSATLDTFEYLSEATPTSVHEVNDDDTSSTPPPCQHCLQLQAAAQVI